MLKILGNVAGMAGAAVKELFSSSADPRQRVMRSTSLWICDTSSKEASGSAGGSTKPLTFTATAARFSLADVRGMISTTERILAALREASLAQPGKSKNGLLLYGPPGVGKTFLLECCAGELGLPIVWLTIGGANSMWVGEKTGKVKQAFDDARAQAPCVLFIDEIDSFLVRREQIANADSEMALVVNTFLTELDAIRGKGVAVVGATNFVERLDAAAVREGRFDWKVHVPQPDLTAREALIRDALAQGRATMTEGAIAAFARHWEGFSVARILSVVREAIERRGENLELSVQEVTQAWIAVRGAPPDSVSERTPTLDNLILAPDLGAQLSGLARRMIAFIEIGMRGGTIPRGLLFSGPPGTGKTLTARALGKATGWSMISIRGADLLADIGRIDELAERASRYRPSIVFIDEADDVLARRSTSFHAAFTNKLLAVIDGGDPRLNDVLFVAATNHPEALDPAMLRGGRFGQHFHFAPPSREMVHSFVKRWSEEKRIPSEGRSLIDDALLDGFEGRTLADIAEILQEALNSSLDGDQTSNVSSIREGIRKKCGDGARRKAV